MTTTSKQWEHVKNEVTVTTKNCKGCGQPLIALNDMALQQIRANKLTLCPECRRKPISQWTKSTYQEYLKTEHWQRRRQRALNLATNKCQVCSSTDRLEAHHNNYERLGGELDSDLIVLCRRHHELFHNDGELAY